MLFISLLVQLLEKALSSCEAGVDRGGRRVGVATFFSLVNYIYTLQIATDLHFKPQIYCNFIRVNQHVDRCPV